MGWGAGDLIKSPGTSLMVIVIIENSRVRYINYFAREVLAKVFNEVWFVI